MTQTGKLIKIYDRIFSDALSQDYHEGVIAEGIVVEFIQDDNDDPGIIRLLTNAGSVRTFDLRFDQHIRIENIG